MKLVVGLGNPGPEYETTRHNAGFLALDRLVERLKAEGPRLKEKAETFTATHAGEKLLLVKPLTFMNRSGDSVAPLANFHKVEPSDVIVLHDEIDLPFGSLRIKTGGGAGGHNGIRSIDQRWGAEKTEYHRVRIGVGRPAVAGEKPKRMAVVDFVLEAFSDEELGPLDEVLDRAADAALLLVEGKALQAMNQFNRRATPGGKEEEE